MEFIETPTFTAAVVHLLDDKEYGKLQFALARNVNAGSLIRGGGGLRKIRWSSSFKRKGKRGGIRIIYYAAIRNKVYMLFVYDKNDQKDLTHDQLKILAAYVKGRVV